MNKGTALITGASSGLGVDFAKQIAAQGYDLVITARRKDLLERLKTEIESMHTQQVHVIAADLSASGGAQTLLREIRNKKIDITFLVNNAGFGHMGNFENVSAAEIESVLQVNMNALTTLIRELMLPMQQRNEGRIINVASVAAFQAVPWFGVYAATKAYVLSLTESLAIEQKESNIKISCLCPGPTRTGFSAAAGVSEDLGPDFLWMQSEDVVRQGLHALEKKQVICVPGITNKIQVNATALIPRSIVSSLAGLIYKPKK